MWHDEFEMIDRSMVYANWWATFNLFNIAFTLFYMVYLLGFMQFQFLLNI